MSAPWYSVGTVTFTSGSVDVVGVETAWVDQVDEGDVLTDHERWYEVAAVTDATHLRLRRPYAGASGAGRDYAIVRNFDVTVAGDLAARVTGLVAAYTAYLRDFRTWLAGSRTGGPAGDGRYPLTDGGGTVRSLLCPDWWETLRSGAGSGTSGSGTAAVRAVTEFGAVGDGVADCTAAFRTALATAKGVFVPAGTWRITAPIQLDYGQALYGVGESSVIQARDAAFDGAALPAYPSAFNAVELVSGYATVRDLRIVGGATGIKLYGATGPCVKNVVENVSIWDARIGIVLDGYATPDRPCYWNNLSRVLIARPQMGGVLLTVESTGDTPNANKFHDVRVYSLSAPLSGSAPCGFFVSAGKYNNSFVDCEANLHPSAQACFRLGAMADQNKIINFYAECSGAVPGIRIDNGADNTAIINLFSATGGAAIWDPTGQRRYTAVNAGHPTTTLLKQTTITDLYVEGVAYDTDYVEPAGGGLVTPDLTAASIFLVSSYGGAVEFRLPRAGTATGRRVVVKKTDLSANLVTITENGGPGPDNRPVLLANRYDFLEVVSNGANWWIVGERRPPGDTAYVEGVALYVCDGTKDLYLVSAYTGATEFRLPAPNSATAIGRTVTVKKSDFSSNAVRVTAATTTGPDGYAINLSAEGRYLTVMSNGAKWVIVNRYGV